MTIRSLRYSRCLAVALLPPAVIMIASVAADDPAPTTAASMPTRSTWPMFRRMPQGLNTDSEPGKGELAWKRQLGRSIWSSPIVEGDDLYIGSDVGRLFRLGVIDGAWRWSAPIGSACTATPVISGDLVMVGTRDGYLVARDKKTGDPRWSVAVGGLIHQIALCADVDRVHKKFWSL